MEEFDEVFGEDLPRDGARVEPMHLELDPDSTPAPEGGRRRYAPAIWEKILKEVEALQEAELIEEVFDSEFISPVVMVKKPNSANLRFCVDYKAVNKQLLVKSYQLPNISDILDGCAKPQPL